MKFYTNQLFHIYNQGNNRQVIFFNDDNYQFFLWKMRAYLLPFGELIAYCLMPNHFHWQFYVKTVEIKRQIFWEHVDKVEYQRRLKKYGNKAQAVKKEHHRTRHLEAIFLNESIAYLLKSYTRAINKQKGWTGSLFRNKTKAKDGFIDEFISLRKLNGQLDSRFMSGTDYAYRCFDYIHKNPEEADLVLKATDWVYSSAKDYAGLRRGTLCNLKLAKELILGL